MPYRHGAIGLSTVASAGRKEQFILLEIGLSTVSKGQWWLLGSWETCHIGMETIGLGTVDSDGREKQFVLLEIGLILSRLRGGSGAL